MSAPANTAASVTCAPTFFQVERKHTSTKQTQRLGAATAQADAPHEATIAAAAAYTRLGDGANQSQTRGASPSAKRTRTQAARRQSSPSAEHACRAAADAPPVCCAGNCTLPHARGANAQTTEPNTQTTTRRRQNHAARASQRHFHPLGRVLRVTHPTSSIRKPKRVRDSRAARRAARESAPSDGDDDEPRALRSAESAQRRASFRRDGSTANARELPRACTLKRLWGSKETAV